MSSIKMTENICRTCLSTDGELISLFSDDSCNARLTNKLMNISDVTIYKHDGLPYTICKKCIFLVESFHCFKKQIESANKRIKQIWSGINNDGRNRKKNTLQKIDNSIQIKIGEEYDDSDYEVQYISEEVKREVENAFRRKNEKKRKKEFTTILKPNKTIDNVGLISFKHSIDKEISIKRTVENMIVQSPKVIFLEKEKNNQMEIFGQSASSYSNEIEEKDIEIISENLSRVEDSNCAEEEMTKTEILDDVERETFQSGNSDCNDRLIIETEDFDDIEEKNIDAEYIDPEKTLQSEKMENEKESNLKSSCGAPKKMYNSKTVSNDVPKSLDALNLICDTKKQKIEREKLEENNENTSIDLCSNNEKIILVSETVNDDQTRIFDPENRKFIEEKSKYLKPCEIQFNNEKIFQVKKSDNIKDKVLSMEESHDENDEECTESENRLKIVEEAMETVEFRNKTKESEELNTLNPSNDGKDSHELFDPEKSENPSEFEKTNEIIKSCPQSKENAEKRTEALSNFQIDENETDKKLSEKNNNSLEVTTDNSNKNETEIKKTMVTNEKIKILNKNGKLIKSSNNKEIIVISSDSSDEERRKNYLETINRRGSWLPRKTRQKLFQARVIARKNHILQMQEKTKIRKEILKNQSVLKKGQPRKYFQCTSCNISLYSVSAVLYHHNQTHTPAQDLLSCQMCELKFPTKILLQAHFDQHTESHLYRCSYCTCEFVLRKNLRAHTNNHLKLNTTEPETKRLKIELPTEKEEISNKENSEETRNQKVLDKENKIDEEIIDENGCG